MDHSQIAQLVEPGTVNALVAGSSPALGAIHLGDCLQILKSLSDASLDSLVTDPPAGIAFMGKEWDKDKGGRDHWVAWMTEVMTECLRVLKPGAHGLVWALPRTSHWTATALENAGFEIRDVVTHLFGTGFPKSLDISKAIAKRAEFETAPATPESRQWQGWGTALKPACEMWILVRKPCSEKTVAANVLRHGTGGINVDGCRILSDGKRPDICSTCAESPENTSASIAARKTKHAAAASSTSIAATSVAEQPSVDGLTTRSGGSTPSGRFPSNLVLSHSEGCRQVGTKKVKAIAPPGAPSRGKPEASGGSWAKGKTTEKLIAHNDGDGTETVEAWECEPGCAVRMLDEQSGLAKPKPARSGRIGGLKGEVFGNGNTGFNPEGEGYWPADLGGGASRFFYCAKASKLDRNRKVKRGEQASNREVHKPDELFDSSGNPARREGA